jgi:hypothetical protein
MPLAVPFSARSCCRPSAPNLAICHATLLGRRRPSGHRAPFLAGRARKIPRIARYVGTDVVEVPTVPEAARAAPRGCHHVMIPTSLGGRRLIEKQNLRPDSTTSDSTNGSASNGQCRKYHIVHDFDVAHDDGLPAARCNILDGPAGTPLTTRCTGRVVRLAHAGK